MTGPTHRIGGLAAGTILISLLHINPSEGAFFITGALLGSLLPDIDNRHSSISRKWNIMSLFVHLGQKLLRGIAGIFPNKQKDYICSLIGHRGLTHSVIAIFFVPGIIFLIMKDIGHMNIGRMLAIGMSVGIFSHLFLDMLAGGVPLFMPFSIKRIAFLHIKTGGVVEWIFRILMISVFIYFGWEAVLWQRLLQV